MNEPNRHNSNESKITPDQFIDFFLYAIPKKTQNANGMNINPQGILTNLPVINNQTFNNFNQLEQMIC